MLAWLRLTRDWSLIPSLRAVGQIVVPAATGHPREGLVLDLFPGTFSPIAGLRRSGFQLRIFAEASLKSAGLNWETR